MDNIKPWEITIRDTIATLFRQKKIIIITLVITTISAFIGLKLKTPLYEAHVKMLIRGRSQVAALSYQAISPFRIHLTQAEIVKSNPVIRRAVEALQLDQRPLDYEKNFSSKMKWPVIDIMADNFNAIFEKLSPEEKRNVLLNKAAKYIKSNLRTDLIPHTDIFVISVLDYSPDGAIALANVISRSYAIFDQEQQLAELTLRYGNLHPSVIQLKDNIYNATKNLHGKNVSTIEAIGTASVKVIEQAVSSYQPVGKPKLLTMFIALFFSFFVGIALSLLFNFFNNTFKSPHDIVNHLGLPVIGSIPKKGFLEKVLVSEAKQNTPYCDFYEDLAEQLVVFMKTQGLKSLIIASAEQNDINSSIATNISYNLSNKLGYKTLLIDGNIKDPVVNKIFKIKGNPGVSNIIEGSNIENSVHDMGVNLHIIPTEKISFKTAELIGKMESNKFIKSLTDKYEIILIDCSRMENLNNLSLFSNQADGAVIIVGEGKGRRQVIINRIKPIRNRINIIGAIFNNRTFPIPKIIYNRL